MTGERTSDMHFVVLLSFCCYHCCCCRCCSSVIKCHFLPSWKWLIKRSRENNRCKIRMKTWQTFCDNFLALCNQLKFTTQSSVNRIEWHFRNVKWNVPIRLNMHTILKIGDMICRILMLSFPSLKYCGNIRNTNVNIEKYGKVMRNVSTMNTTPPDR